MKRLKHGVSLVAVLVALFVASLGGSYFDFTASTSDITPESIVFVLRRHRSIGDQLVGTQGLHW